LFALSPSFTYYSRAVDGRAIVAFCALGLVAAVADWLQRQDPKSIYLAVALCILAVLAGPLGYGLVLVLVTYPLVVSFVGRTENSGGIAAQVRQARYAVLSDPRSLRGALLMALVLVLAVGTAFTLNPSGLQMALDQFGLWLRDFGVGRHPWYRGLVVLLLYEAPPLLLGAVGLYRERKQGDVVSLLLRHWFIVGLLLTLLTGSRAPGNAVLVLIPLILEAGRAVEALWRTGKVSTGQPLFWVLVGLSLVVAFAGYVQFAQYLISPVQAHLLRLAALSIFVMSVHVLLVSLMGAQIALHAAAGALVLLCSLVSLRTGVRLNYSLARDPLEPIVGRTTAQDVLALAEYAAELSSHLEGDERVMAWQVDETLEIPLGWYLRRFNNVEYLPEVAENPDRGGVIVPSEAPAAPQLAGLRFALHVDSPRERRSAQEWLRWWTGHNSVLEDAVIQDEVMLWVRSPR
jgi:predicted membrane-bound mannosyltransferase